MRAMLLRSMLGLFILVGSSYAQDGNATAYVIHGIRDQDLDLEAALHVDVAVDGNCALQGFVYGQIAGPLSLAAGSHSITIDLADPANPCSAPAVIAADVPFAAGEVAVVIAHLAADGTPTASKFLIDQSMVEEARSRITLHHAAAAPAVDIQLRSTECDWMGQSTFEGVPNGGQGSCLMQAGGVLTDNLGRQANIIATNVEASNGVIHAIDAVVLLKAPPDQ